MKNFVLNHLLRSWWVFIFVFICAILYEQGLKQRERSYQQLTQHLQILQQAKQRALTENQNLKLQIDSQNDFSWIELCLMKNLGLIRKEEQKIYFYPEKN